MTCLRRVVLLALVAVSSLLASQQALADIVISNPVNPGYQVGVWDNGTNAFGVLVNNGLTQTGFKNPNGTDPYGVVNFAFGTPRDAYGVSAGAFHGYVDPNNANLTALGQPLISPNMTSATLASSITSFPATIRSFLSDGNGVHVLQIDQTFSFPFGANNPNVLKIGTTLTNVTFGTVEQQTLTNVLFRRVTEFTFTNTVNQPNVVVTVPGAGAAILSTPPGGVVTSVTPFSFGPGVGTGNFQRADPTVPFTPLPPGTYGPGDQGGGFTLNLGDLVASVTGPNQTSSASFNWYYAVNTPAEGATGNAEAALISQLKSLGINYLISSHNATTDGNGDPANQASGVIGLEVNNIPEPATMTLLGLGLAGLAGWHRRRCRRN